MHMVKDEFDFQVLNLTPQFYRDYPTSLYNEIVQKGKRPYNCLLIQSHYDYFICLSYRSHIKHPYAYKFKHSKRSLIDQSGLDYSKIIIITNTDYIGSTDALIDQDEYKETRDNIHYIRNDAQRYIDDYIAHLQKTSNKYDQKEFSRIYQYSTLKYFHKELSIV